MSAKLSSCSPNALWLLVKRATRPSMPSSTMAMNTDTAALSKRPCMDWVMAKNAANKAAMVNELGSR